MAFLDIFKRKPKIDPALKAQLEARGKTDKVKELEAGASKAKVTVKSVMESAASSIDKVIKYTTGGNVLAKGVGDALASGYREKLMTESDKREDALRTQINAKLKDANLPAEQKKRMVDTLNAPRPDWMDPADLLKTKGETAKEIFGDGARLALTAALSFKPGLKGAEGASASFKLLGGAQVQQYKAARMAAKTVGQLARAKKYAELGKVGKVLKFAERRGIPLAKSGLFAGTEEALFAMSRGENKEQITKAFKRGYVIGVVAPLVIEGVVRTAVGGTKLVGNKVFKPIYGKAVKALQKASLEVPPGLVEKLQRFDTELLASVNTGKAYSEYPAEALFRTEIDDKVIANVGEQAGEAIQGRILTPSFAKGRIDDIAMKLDYEFPNSNMGELFRKRVDPSLTSLEELYRVGNETITSHLSTPQGIQALRVAAAKGDITAQKLAMMAPKEKFTTKVARKLLAFDEGVRSLPSRFIDRFHTLDKAQQRLLASKGPLEEGEKFYRDARMAQSAADAKAEYMLTDFFGSRPHGVAGEMSQYGDVEDLVRARLLALDEIDRIKLGDISPLGNTSKDLPRLEEELKGLIEEAGEHNPRVMAAVQTYRDFTNRLLDMSKDAGLIDDELLATLRQTHPNYVPHELADKVDDLADAYRFNSGSLNVPSTDIKRTTGGAAKPILDPFEALINRTRATTKIAEKNKVITELVQAHEQTPLFEGMYKIEGNVPRGTPTISLFRNGAKEVWAVPADVETAIKNLDAEAMSKTWKFLTTPQRLLKKFATQLNISFSIPNLARDRQTAYVTADAFIKSLAEQSKNDDLVDLAKMSTDDLKRLYMESGGYGSSVFKEDGPVTESLDYLKKNGFWQELANDVNPKTLVTKFNDSIEQSTRMSVFQKGLAAGLSPKDAAFAAREATIDFAKMGTQMRTLNQAIPFLNARVQGFLNNFKAATLAPEVYGRTVFYSAVLPTMAIHNWNRQFESYANIPEYFQDNYWNLMTGEQEVLGDDGQMKKVPQFISVRKGEVQQLVANPINWYLNKADKVDPRGVGEMIVDTLGNASPVAFGGFDSTNPWGALISQVGPYGSIPTGLGTNVDPYKGTPIVPPSRLDASPELQYKKTTPEIVKQIGKTLGVSPAKIDFVINSFGGVPQDITQVANLLQGAVQEGKLRVDPLTDTMFGKFSRLPLFRRFFRESSPDESPQKRAADKEVEAKLQPLIDEKIRIKEKAAEINKVLNGIDDRAQQVRYLNELKTSGELNDAVREELAAMKKSARAVGDIKASMSTNERAWRVAVHLDKLKADNVSKKEMVAYLDQLKSKGIFTKDVQAKVKQIQQYGQITKQTNPTEQTLTAPKDAPANVNKPRIITYKEIPAEARVYRLPDSLGGGEFATMPNGEPVILERDDSPQFRAVANRIRGGTFDETSQEVDHLVSLALGGTNDPENLEGKPNLNEGALKNPLFQFAIQVLAGRKANAQDFQQMGKTVVEHIAISKYRAGEISLAQARAAIINWNNRPEVFLSELDEDEKQSLKISDLVNREWMQTIFQL